jgi:sulfur carrier protein
VNGERGPACITVRLNGEGTELPPHLTLALLIERLGVRGRYAVELNGEIVPRSAHLAWVVRDGDVIEVVHAIGGG